ncbi:MAG: glycosyltransferase family 2 protein [Myxococcales bacterium]|nr:glycosyltransferase family 2 protein [Myxococcales bacterium]
MGGSHSASAQGSDARPLLCLCMIVKDEAATIARTLESVKPFVDRWVVLDTGSSDDTRERVRALMAGTPGAVHEAPFVDFATTRNHALDLCGADAEFILWLDADDVLVGGKALRAGLGRERALCGPDREAYFLRVEAGVAFDSARVLRARDGWRFKGVVHEVLMREGRQPPVHRIEGVLIRHEVGDEALERSRRRWERDVGLLGAVVAADPSDTRAAFYLGLTYFWLGRWEEAIAALERRAAMGGWHEEVYQARMHVGVAAERAGRPWPEVLDLYLRAHATAPQRAEPLHAIALHYNLRAEHALCVLFARRGYELPYPKEDRLFVDEAVYHWQLADLVASSAYWIGAFELGLAAARQAVRARPDDPRLRQNLEHYLAQKRRPRGPR